MEIGKQSSVILIEFSEVACPSTQNSPGLPDPKACALKYYIQVII